jgi:phenylacetate-CoA ligase
MRELETEIPSLVRERHPLMTPQGYQTFRRIHEHRHAPRWTYAVGDRVTTPDLETVESLRMLLRERQVPLTSPSDAIAEQTEGLAARCFHYRERLPARFDARRDWHTLPTSDRNDLAEVEMLVPTDVDLSRLITYGTSGTTGPVMRIPTHPQVNAQNHALGEYAIATHGVTLAPQAGEVACLGVSAQAHTYTFATIFSVWHGAGFAKVNLKSSEWPEGRESARAFFGDLRPQLLTGEPVSFAVAAAWQLPVNPIALISTATALAPALASSLRAHFGCPVLDWYSLSETGPIAYSAPDGQGMCIFPYDLLVEIIDDEGNPARAGVEGEIVVTTFRNPYLPLLRYRTGDYARLMYVPTEHGPEVRLFDLVARRSASFRTPEGEMVNPVDIARVVNRTGIYVQHECVQRADHSIDLLVQPLVGMDPRLDELEAGLREYFGPRQVLRVRADEQMPKHRHSKTLTYRSELG